MERRALLAAVLCLLVLLVYQEALKRFYPPPPESTEVAASSPAPTAAVGMTDEPSPPQRPLQPLPVQGSSITVDTDLYTAQISTGGGRLTSLRLKKYRSAVAAESEPLEMVEVGPGPAPLGARVSSNDGSAFEDDTQVAYGADRSELAIAGTETGTLALRGTLPSGAQIEKTFRFSGGSYPIGVDVKVQDAEKYPRVGIDWRHHIDPTHATGPDAHYQGVAVLADKKVVRELASSVLTTAPKAFDPPVGWVSYADHYFVAALIPSDPSQARTAVVPRETAVELALNSPRGGAADEPTHFTVYVGPKDVEVLEATGYQLERVVDFGWFSFLAVPLLRLLKMFHGFTHNYGVDIIVLTILIKVLFIPLTSRSMKSMRDMQRLQPQMAKLREKFKDDREKLNKETIELYRRHRVNPLGGCLPMLLQIPVFIGLYQALSQAIELRHAPFALWVHDLSAHECYPWPGQGTIHGCNEFALLGLAIPILVLLMGGSMILQQYLSPASGMDPAQQRMMMVLMPVMMTVMFINFPSGLVLYWLVNNVLTIAQQWWANREPMPTPTK